MEPYMYIFPVLMVLGIIIPYVIYSYANYKSKKKVQTLIDEIQNDAREITPEEFFEMRSLKFSGRIYVSEFNFAGVYVLRNITKNLCYVGQGQRIFDRVNMHFTGKGNGDVYADYKYGDSFTIRMFPLENSGFETLNDLERSMISYFDAKNNGYNKTRGNR